MKLIDAGVIAKYEDVDPGTLVLLDLSGVTHIAMKAQSIPDKNVFWISFSPGYEQGVGIPGQPALYHERLFQNGPAYKLPDARFELPTDPSVIKVGTRNEFQPGVIITNGDKTGIIIADGSHDVGFLNIADGTLTPGYPQQDASRTVSFEAWRIVRPIDDKRIELCKFSLADA
jgi:hypothetical protein